MKITQTQLDEAIALHGKWLRNEPDGVRAVLYGANLSGAILARANLTGADLYGANLTGAILRDANLTGANLTEANLYGANMREANLTEANLYGANLREANLFGSNLRGADLYGAILTGADLSRANLRGADLRCCIGNSREVKLVQTSRWTVTYTAEVMAIGCQQHGIAEWWAFTDSEIARMDREALDWWRVWKPILQQMIANSPATPTGCEGGE